MFVFDDDINPANMPPLYIQVYNIIIIVLFVFVMFDLRMAENLPPCHHFYKYYNITKVKLVLLMFVFKNDVNPATMPPLYKTITLLL